MRAVIQRVLAARIEVEGSQVAEIGKGLVVYLGVGKGDTSAVAEHLAKKIANLRIFEDKRGKMNFSALSVGFDILLVSQFTLYADTSHGNRPGFADAEGSMAAKELYESVAERLSEQGIIAVKKGVFGADMKILQINDGPVTIIMEA